VSHTHISASLRQKVFKKAGGRCEYCGLPERFSFGWFPSPSLGTHVFQAPAWSFIVKLELPNHIPKLELGNERILKLNKPQFALPGL
jgi:hypothetical protein